MEKNVKISILCEIYKNMLTDKQYTFLDDYYNNDLSLSEIAENSGITRQAVRDVIKQGENKLFEMEEKLSFMSKLQIQEKKIAEALEDIEDIEKMLENEILQKSIRKLKEKIKEIEII